MSALETIRRGARARAERAVQFTGPEREARVTRLAERMAREMSDAVLSRLIDDGSTPGVERRVIEAWAALEDWRDVDAVADAARRVA